MVNVLTAALVAQVLTERKKPDKTYFFQYYRSQTHEGIEYSSIAYSVLLCPGRLRTVTQMCSTEQYSEYGTELTPKYSEYSEYEYSIRVLSTWSTPVLRVLHTVLEYSECSVLEYGVHVIYESIGISRLDNNKKVLFCVDK
jgi:hypothetical protein